MNYLYTTLITSNDYTMGAIGLVISSREQKIKYPFIVMVTDNVTNTYLLDEANIQYRIFPYKELTSKEDYYFTINKLYAYEFAEYERIMFIDADIILFTSLDYLIENNELYFIAHQPRQSYHKWSKIWGGLFIVPPMPGLIERIDLDAFRDDEEIFSAIYYKPEFSQWLHNNDTKWPFHHDNHMKHFNNSLKYWNRFNIDTVEKMEIFIKLIYQDPQLLTGDF